MQTNLPTCKKFCLLYWGEEDVEEQIADKHIKYNKQTIQPRKEGVGNILSINICHGKE